MPEKRFLPGLCPGDRLFPKKSIFVFRLSASVFGPREPVRLL